VACIFIGPPCDTRSAFEHDGDHLACELADGRVLVLAYEGEHLRTVTKSIETTPQLGSVRAERSGRSALFAVCSSSAAASTSDSSRPLRWLDQTAVTARRRLDTKPG